MTVSSLSIIIPTLHSPTLEQTLQALAAQTSLERVGEILVAGQQDIPSLPALPRLRCIRVEDRPTPARNRNAGARSASGDWLLFTDADCLPAVDWVAQLAAAIDGASKSAQPGPALAGTVDIPAQMTYWGRCDHFFGFEHQALGPAHPRQIPYAATLNFAVRREVFLELGGFDESFSSAAGEDREFCHRLTARGYPIFLVPGAVVVHHHARAGLPDAWWHIYRYGVMAAVFRSRHLRSTSGLWRLGRALARLPLFGELGGGLRALMRGLLRPVRQTYFLRHPALLPGMLVLDLALTLGLLHGMRET